MEEQQQPGVHHPRAYLSRSLLILCTLLLLTISSLTLILSNPNSLILPSLPLTIPHLTQSPPHVSPHRTLLYNPSHTPMAHTDSNLDHARVMPVANPDSNLDHTRLIPVAHQDSHLDHSSAHHRARESSEANPALSPGPSTARRRYLLNTARRRYLLNTPNKCELNQSAIVTAADVDRKQDPLVWRPRTGKYLVPLCEYGRLSNQLHCMRRYFYMAALLNRTLIIPREGYSGNPSYSYRWRWDALLDLPKLISCLSTCCSEPAPAVMTIDNYLRMHKKKCLTIDTMYYFHKWHKVRITDAHKRLGLCPFQGEVLKLPEKAPGTGAYSSTEFLEQVADSQNVGILSLGGMYRELLMDLDFERRTAPFELPPECGDLYSANSKILSFADNFLAQHTGPQGTYASLHLRRGDFKVVYKNKEASYLAIPEVAKEVHEWMHPLNVTVLYVASDGTAKELKQLEKLLRWYRFRSREKLRVVSLGLLGSRMDEVPGAEDVHALEIGEGGVILATLEKYLCAYAKAFLGTPHSTFSQDITRIRLASNIASCQDSLLWSTAPGS